MRVRAWGCLGRLAAVEPDRLDALAGYWDQLVGREEHLAVLVGIAGFCEALWAAPAGPEDPWPGLARRFLVRLSARLARTDGPDHAAALIRSLRACRPYRPLTAADVPGLLGLAQRCAGHSDALLLEVFRLLPGIPGLQLGHVADLVPVPQLYVGAGRVYEGLALLECLVRVSPRVSLAYQDTLLGVLRNDDPALRGAALRILGAAANPANYGSVLEECAKAYADDALAGTCGLRAVLLAVDLVARFEAPGSLVERSLAILAAVSPFWPEGQAEHLARALQRAHGEQLGAADWAFLGGSLDAVLQSRLAMQVLLRLVPLSQAAPEAAAALFLRGLETAWEENDHVLLLTCLVAVFAWAGKRAGLVRAGLGRLVGRCRASGVPEAAYLARVILREAAPPTEALSPLDLQGALAVLRGPAAACMLSFEEERDAILARAAQFREGCASDASVVSHGDTDAEPCDDAGAESHDDAQADSPFARISGIPQFPAFDPDRVSLASDLFKGVHAA